MDLSTAQSKLTAAQSAYDKALLARSSGIGDRNVVRQDIRALRDEIVFWERQVAELTSAAAGSNKSGVVLAKWS